MCGRARCTLRPEDVPRASHRHGVSTRFLHLDRYRPSYNVAPGSNIPVLRRDSEVVGDGGVTVECMKWGLVPSFTKKTDKPDFFKMFNARSESVDEKPSFRRLLPKNRCLVAVDGFYEWKKEGSKKQPYYIHFKDGRPLVFAALFDSWHNSAGETLYTFTILTTSSSSSLHWLHDRMPVILGDKDSVDTWLDDPSTQKLKPLLTPYENSDLVWYPVTSAIGKLTFDGPECIQQIPLKASQNSLISKFFSTEDPKTEKVDKETKLTDVKEEHAVEGYQGVSDSIEKTEELDEEKDVGFQKIVKAEPVIEDNSAVASSHIESVKSEAEEGTNVEGKPTRLAKETGESNAIIPSVSLRISKEEPETRGHRFTTVEELNQLEHQQEAVEDKPRNENQKTCQTKKEGDLEFSKNSSGKSGTKRDYEVLSAEKRWKHGKQQGKGKSNSIKKSKETQSTLHFFFDGK
uniref:Embryonic stem cell-specific 5-hydroxymethylcytosine-binding protein n=1 Tax=Noccaea caerulescens TaxID=107243 RepID=A0A1J3JK76_NOCCA